MVEIKIGRGLCMTCNNAPSCFHRARRGPALFCETFDNYVPPADRGSDRMASPLAGVAMAVDSVEEEVGKHAGLCSNCEHRQTCRHPRPAGGVWHCENYA
ncbi:MAG: hypothetical protein JSU63_14325 [Phycisphaerales bacterium]|nr:MAG: hypothetical protein JSU63_14325 [Phycisphaerales bacterium]